jgi:hypothetical protein
MRVCDSQLQWSLSGVLSNGVMVKKNETNRVRWCSDSEWTLGKSLSKAHRVNYESLLPHPVVNLQITLPTDTQKSSKATCLDARDMIALWSVYGFLIACAFVFRVSQSTHTQSVTFMPSFWSSYARSNHASGKILSLEQIIPVMVKFLIKEDMNT